MVSAKNTSPCLQTRGYSRVTIALSVIALALVVFQAVQLFRIIDRFAVDVPFWDQWDFYNPFFKSQGLWNMFSWQHGPHRQGAGSFIMWAVNVATDWNQRAQSFTVGIIMTAVAAAFLWLKQRLFSSLQWYDAIPVLMILSRKPLEIYYGGPNVSHGALPLLLIILLCIVLTLNNMLLRYCLAAALYFLTTFTGYGLLAAPILPVLLIIDWLHRFRNRQWKQTCITTGALLCCLAAIACFYHAYHFESTADSFQFPDEHWYLYPVFMAITFSAAVLPGKLISLPSITVGLSIIAVLLYMVASSGMKLCRQDEHYHRHQTICFLIAFSLVYSAGAAVGRICFGLGAAEATRYVPLIMPGLIGAYLFCLAVPALVNSRIIMPLLFATTVFLLLTGWPWERYSVPERCRDRKNSWIEAFKQTNDVSLADTLSGYSIYPDPERTGLARKLEWLRLNRYSLFRDNATPDNPEASK